MTKALEIRIADPREDLATGEDFYLDNFAQTILANTDPLEKGGQITIPVSLILETSLAIPPYSFSASLSVRGFIFQLAIIIFLDMKIL